MIPKASSVKEHSNKTSSKSKTAAFTKRPLRDCKDKTDWRQVFAGHGSGEGLVYRGGQKSQNSTARKPVKKLAKYLNRHFTRKKEEC